MRIALYARVSTKEEKRFQDPETQLSVLRSAAERDGHVVFKEYVDYLSGKDEDRTNYQLMKEESEHYDAVMFYDHSRFMRSQSSSESELRWFKEHGIILMFEREGIVFNDLHDSPEASFQFQILMATAEYFRRSNSKKVKDGIARYRKSGKAWGRPIRTDVEHKTPLLIALFRTPRDDGKPRTIYDVSRETKLPVTTIREHLKRQGIDYKDLRERQRNTDI